MRDASESGKSAGNESRIDDFIDEFKICFPCKNDYDIATENIIPEA
jgi:hypothetical protein